MNRCSKIIVQFFVVACFSSCGVLQYLPVSSRQADAVTGSAFYKDASNFTWEERENAAVQEMLSGNMPDFLKRFVRIDASFVDASGKKVDAYYFVLPDYLSIGNKEDFARIPLTPLAAQKIADSLHCFLPSSKMVDDIYRQAKIKLEPQPMFAFRDSAATFYHHHLIIEGQRKLQKGLIAGIKKDIVLTSKLTKDQKPQRVAIYGWHKLDGKPIQQTYIGHANWYVDYSHGVRLVYEMIYVNGKAIHYQDVLADPLLKGILCNEVNCDFNSYSY